MVEDDSFNQAWQFICNSRKSVALGMSSMYGLISYINLQEIYIVISICLFRDSEIKDKSFHHFELPYVTLYDKSIH